MSGSEKQVKVKIPAVFRVSRRFSPSMATNDAGDIGLAADHLDSRQNANAAAVIYGRRGSLPSELQGSVPERLFRNRRPLGGGRRWVRFRRSIASIGRRRWRRARSRRSRQSRLWVVHRHSGHAAEHRALSGHESARGLSIRTDRRGTIVVRRLAHGTTDAGGNQCHPYQAAEFPFHGFAFAEQAACSGLASKWLVTAPTITLSRQASRIRSAPPACQREKLCRLARFQEPCRRASATSASDCALAERSRRTSRTVAPALASAPRACPPKSQVPGPGRTRSAPPVHCPAETGCSPQRRR